MTFNIRESVVDAIKPLLPKTWKYIPNISEPETISAPTVMIWLESIERLVEGPQSGHYRANYSIRILQPKSTPGVADDLLENDLIDLLEALDKGNCRWQNPVERIVWNETYPGFRVPVTSIIQPD